VKRLSEI